ncbi:venom phosphodiesterase 2-like isoform X2 [Palaemon carinicauda]|uniref:venom phosphodiesterase 2-like isoform X2 n=1 Tax=Palaemon carinicauda TaxID=392227 RepID=UPI0035B6AA46
MTYMLRILAVGLLPSIVLAQLRSFEECPAEYGDTKPVLLVSIDGFRAGYLERGITPTIQALADAGVTASHMIASYPTLTFPNHYTIVTGTYPEHHGIIANNFYDPYFHQAFSLSSNTTKDGKWWGAEPIWNTVTDQGKISATYFWPGSDANIGGKHPTYWYGYNDSTPFEERIDKVLEWLTLPVESRPSWISLYFSEPDHTGHGSGPDSSEEEDQIMRMDLMMRHLLDGLEAAGLTHCVNIIVVSDHGMAPSGEEYIINLSEYIPEIERRTYLYGGAFTRIEPKDDSQDVKINMMEQLVCQRHEMRVFEREGLPTRFHFANNRRIEPIVLDLDPGFTGSKDYGFYLNGEHGYDNYFPLMNALFIASGPAFKQQLRIEPFQNIELYNLMCHLSGVKPSPNNGTEGSLYHILANPPDAPVIPKEDPPPSSMFPDGDLQPLLNIAGCDGDLQRPEDWLQSFNLSPAQEETLRSLHLPWGIPHSGDLPADLTLLHHKDHVTAYSQLLRMPLWSSFSMNVVPSGTSFAPWSSDIRLTPKNTITCNDYESLPLNYTMHTLFPPALSKEGSLSRVPYMVSNAVPMNIHQAGIWEWLTEGLVLRWFASQGPLNVVVGPLFDSDANSLVDDFRMFGIPEIPSDMFAVVTRCKDRVPSIDRCLNSSLDALAFIFPQYEAVSNCMDQFHYTLKFSAKVHDVELATGLTFYPDLPFEDRSRVTLRVNPELWPSV